MRHGTIVLLSFRHFKREEELRDPKIHQNHGLPAALCRLRSIFYTLRVYEQNNTSAKITRTQVAIRFSIFPEFFPTRAHAAAHVTDAELLLFWYNDIRERAKKRCPTFFANKITNLYARAVVRLFLQFFFLSLFLVKIDLIQV